MSERTFYRWVEISEAEPVTFAKLLRLMVEASHSDAFAQAVAESNLETELRDLVDAGELMVRNPSTLGRVGAGLNLSSFSRSERACSC